MVVATKASPHPRAPTPARMVPVVLKRALLMSFSRSGRLNTCVLSSARLLLSCFQKAMAQSVTGLRQSAALCGREELPLTMDLLQGSEAVAAVLARYANAGINIDFLIARIR